MIILVHQPERAPNSHTPFEESRPPMKIQRSVLRSVILSAHQHSESVSRGLIEERELHAA